MNGYELSRNWFNFCFDNPELIKPIHSAVFYFSVEHCNRLGWKEKFGFPSQMAMEALGIKNWRTYSKAFNDLVNWGFFTLIQRSKNQYSSNIISLSACVKNTKALDKALQKHSQKQHTKQGQSTVSIIKQENKETNEQENIYVSFDHLSLTIIEFNRIKKMGYSETDINNTIEDIQNYKKNTKYKSLNLTLRKWLRKNVKIADNTEIKYKQPRSQAEKERQRNAKLQQDNLSA